MPELPESDAARLVVERQCLNRTIETAEPGGDVEYIDLPGDNARSRLVGHQFTQTRRYGKYIFAGSKTGPWIVVHLGMTGQLIAFDAPDDPPDYTKFLITFEGDRRLAFRCPRKLGSLEVLDDPDAYITAQDLGPDALEIDRDRFLAVIGGTHGAIKSALMAQKKLAGIGNLWSDEICYRIGVDPASKASDLPEQKIVDAYEAMQTVLEGVLDTEAHYSQLPDDWLIRDRNEGADCGRCSGKIAKKKVGSRTSYYCDKHQQ